MEVEPEGVDPEPSEVDLVQDMQEEESDQVVEEPAARRLQKADKS